MPIKSIIPEEEWQCALDSLIEAQFLPALPALRQQAQWLAAVSSNDASAIDRAKEQVKTAIRQARYIAGDTPRPAGARTSAEAQPSVTGSAPTPVRLQQPSKSTEIIFASHPDEQSAGGVASNGSSLRSLDQFLATHTSEDNAAFTLALAHNLAKHRDMFWWAYHQPGSSQRYRHVYTGGGKNQAATDALKHAAAARTEDADTLALYNPGRAFQLGTIGPVPGKARAALHWMPGEVDGMSLSNTTAIAQRMLSAPGQTSKPAPEITPSGGIKQPKRIQPHATAFPPGWHSEQALGIAAARRHAAAAAARAMPAPRSVRPGEVYAPHAIEGSQAAKQFTFVGGSASAAAAGQQGPHALSVGQKRPRSPSEAPSIALASIADTSDDDSDSAAQAYIEQLKQIALATAAAKQPGAPAPARLRYHVPSSSQREALAHDLADKAASKAATPARPASTPRPARVMTPRSQLRGMSPAASRLAASVLRGTRSKQR